MKAILQAGCLLICLGGEIARSAAEQVIVEWTSPGGIPWPPGYTNRVDLPPGLTNIVAVAAGGWFYSYPHSLALKADGGVLAWGDNAHGQAVVPPGLSNIVAIAAGDGHCLALNAQGRVIAWGRDLGENDVTLGFSNVVAIAAGDNRGALRSDGTVVVWGDNAYAAHATAGLSNFVAISPFVALRDDGTLTSWGSYYRTANSISNVMQIASCPTRGLAQSTAGISFNWGTAAVSPPDHATNLVAVACSRSHYLALRPDGTVVSWGDEASPPIGITNVQAIAAADFYSLALIGNSPLVLSSRIVNPGRDADGFSLFVEAQSGRVFRLEYKRSLSDPVWTPLALVAGKAGLLKLSDPTAGTHQRFYRVRRW